MTERAGRTSRKRASATERSSGGDPVRTLDLLWRSPSEIPSTRGPKQRTTVDAVIAAAIDIADSHGLSGVTIRSVAAALGITAMATYTYVPGKSELLDLMLDVAYLQMTHTDFTEMAWRERVSTIAEENLELLKRHPWVVQVAATRPPLGPGMVAKYEHELRAFDGLGLSDLEMDSALTFVLGFVNSVARIAIETRLAAAESGMSDRAWWEEAAPLLDRALDPKRYPLATRVGAAAGEAHDSAYNATHAYEFGLARVLDGLERLIERP